MSPLARAYPSAMKVAPCSWRVVMRRIDGASCSASNIARACVPGMPNTASTPSATSVRTTASPPVILGMSNSLRAYGWSLSGESYHVDSEVGCR